MQGSYTVLKLKKAICFLLFVVFFSTSCVKDEISFDKELNNKKASFTVDNNDFTYKINKPQLFAVDDSGLLYYISRNFDTAMTTLSILNLDGETVKEIEIGISVGISAITVQDGILYYSRLTFGENKSRIYSLDLNTEIITEICVVEGFKEINHLYVINNVVYFIGADETLSGKYYDILNLNDNFLYNGEVIKSYDIENGELNTVFDGFPIAFTKTVDDNLIIYAYDEKNGYYFQEHNILNNEGGKKVYSDISGMPSSFNLTENKDKVIYISDMSLKISELSESKNAVVLEKLYFSNDCFQYKNGCLFYPVKEGIKRVLLSEVFFSLTPLNMAYTGLLFDYPEIKGFSVNQIPLENEEFALSVLSGDSSYDIYCIDSRSGFADNIRAKGAFYPLTDINEAKEYINSVFPYVREAAADKNGDIWMIPNNLSTLYIEYNEKIWENYNLDIKSSLSSLEDMVDIVYYFNNNGINENYNLNAYILYEKYFHQLINKDNGFNRDDFKNMAEYFYDKLNFIKNSVMGYFIFYNERTENNLNEETGNLLNNSYGLNLFSSLKSVLKNEDFNDYKKAEEEYYSNKERESFSKLNYIYNRHIVFPKIKSAEKNDVTCEFICVNPNSKNLGLALEYISEFCKKKLGAGNTFILSDKSTYDDRVFINDFYEIYKDGYIRFGLENELFFDDFIKYLGDEITLDDYLNKAEYKINAYMNE